MRRLGTQRTGPWRKAWAVGTVVFVVLMHVALMGELWLSVLTVAEGRADQVQRMDVQFVQELQAKDPTGQALAPPVVASRAVVVPPRPAPEPEANPRPNAAKELAKTPLNNPPRRPEVRATKRPATALASAASASQPQPETAATLPHAGQTSDTSERSEAAVDLPTANAVNTPTETSPAPQAPLSAPSPDTATASNTLAPGGNPGDTSSSEPFAWPPSTRLTYTLRGRYNGDVTGTARVQWIRKDSRYQVQMDVYVGPELAPAMWRRITSDGILTDQGLQPQRYDEQTRLGFATRRLNISMDGRTVRLAQGKEEAQRPGLQDSASQFVQMSFIFTLNPEKLRPGQSIALPVALPRRMDTWVYEVLKEETVSTDVGDIQAFHVKPRRESPRPGELVPQLWYAPAYQYLPVRILITQDVDVYVDLVLNAKPMQVAPGS